MEPFNLNPNQPQISKNVQDEKRQKGTGFANIGRILKANVGAGQQMGQKVAENLGDIEQRVKSGVGQAQQQFQQQYGQGMGQAQSQLQQAGQFKRQAGESDAAYEQRLASANQDFAKAGEAMRSAEYKGPTDLEKSQQLLSRAQSAAELGDLSRTGMGQGLLLRQSAVAPGRYTRGQGSLDQFLLGQDLQGQKAIQQARRGIANLGTSASDAIKASQTMGQGARTGIEASKAQTGQELQKELGGLQQRGEQAAETYKQEAQMLADYLKQFTPSKTTSDTLAMVDRSPFGGLIRSKQTPTQQQAQQNFDTQKLQDIINRSAEFGLDLDQFSGLYAEDPGQIQAFVNSILPSLKLDAGAKKFSEQQKSSGRALADILGQSDIGKQIQQTQFDTNAFTGDEGQNVSAFKKQLQDARNEDVAKQNLIKNYFAAASMPFDPKGQSGGKMKQAQNALMQAGLWEGVDKAIRQANYEKLGVSGKNWQDQRMRDVQLAALKEYADKQVAGNIDLKTQILQDLARRK